MWRILRTCTLCPAHQGRTNGSKRVGRGYAPDPGCTRVGDVAPTYATLRQKQSHWVPAFAGMTNRMRWRWPWPWLWLWLLLLLSLPLGAASRTGKPRRGGAHGCAPFPEAQEAPYGNSRPACGPHGFIVGRGVRAAFFWLLFFAVQRKVTRARRETLFASCKDKSKSTPPQSSPALRAMEEAEQIKIKIKMDPSFRWDDDRDGHCLIRAKEKARESLRGLSCLSDADGDSRRGGCRRPRQWNGGDVSGVWRRRFV